MYCIVGPQRPSSVGGLPNHLAPALLWCMSRSSAVVRLVVQQ